MNAPERFILPDIQSSANHLLDEMLRRLDAVSGEIALALPHYIAISSFTRPTCSWHRSSTTCSIPSARR
jgi:hypothetical protein